MQKAAYKGLNGYKIAVKIAVQTYKLADLLPEKEKFGLYSQITRSAVSIGSNLSEAFGYNAKQKSHFINISIGSTNELEFQLKIISEIFSIHDSDLNKLIDEEKRILYGLLKAISAI